MGEESIHDGAFREILKTLHKGMNLDSCLLHCLNEIYLSIYVCCPTLQKYNNNDENIYEIYEGGESFQNIRI